VGVIGVPRPAVDLTARAACFHRAHVLDPRLRRNDDFHRLTGVSGAYSQTHSYAAYDNITFKTGIGNYQSSFRITSKSNPP
jgi:hypothetical protein